VSASAAIRITHTSQAARPLRYDPFLLGAVLLLTVLGVVMVYSASAVYAAARLGDGLWFFKRQLAGAILGLGAMVLALRLGYRRLEKLAVPLFLFALLLLLLLHVPGLGRAAGGARRWLALGPLQFQPSEVAKLALVLWLSRSLARRQDRIRDLSSGLLPNLLILGIVGALLLSEPDFGTTAVLVCLTFALLFIAGTPLVHRACTAAVAAPVAAFLVWHSPYRLRRVLAFLDPWADPRGHGYQAVESLLAFGAGGASGVGLGGSHQKLFFLPAAHTDFILSIVGEELGFVGVSGVLLLFAVIIWRGLKAAHNAPEPFGCYVALGVTLLFAFEALVNAGMALSLLPTKGMALPFLSYGMSSVVASLFAAGVLLSVSGGSGGFLKRPAGGLR
jgi:cell division protein FtsW